MEGALAVYTASCQLPAACGIGQVISLVIFVGYSVTYALHIAHNYNQAAMRDARCCSRCTAAENIGLSLHQWINDKLMNSSLRSID